MEGHRRLRLHRAGPPLLVGLALPVLGVVLFSATGRDDSHITFWAADALAQTGSIVNYNGELVEQSSSLLQTLLLAVVSVTGWISTPLAALLLGAVTGAACVVLAWRLAEDIRPGSGWLAGLLTATSTYLVYWSLSGMETPLVALTAVALAVAGGRYLSGKSPPFSAIAAAAAWVLVRPEGVFVVLAALAAAVVFVRPRWRRIGVLAAAALVVFAAVTTWRLVVFGLPFPQPVMAKVGGVGVGAGLRYIWDWTTPALVALGGLGSVAAVAGRRRPTTALAAGVVAAQLAFVVTSGGDWMEGGRMLVPVIPVLCGLAAVALRGMPREPVLVTLVVLLNVGGLFWFARYLSTGQPIWVDTEVPAAWAWPERTNRVHARDALFLPQFTATLEAVDAALDRPVLYASAQAGMVPYYTLAGHDDDVRFIDRWALTTRRSEACRAHTQPPSAYGRELTYSAWAMATEDCGPLPDVVVELGAVDVLPHGYTVLHRERPTRKSGSKVFPGWRLRAREFVAVRDELLPLLNQD